MSRTLLMAAALFAAATLSAKELKVLMIGNSFSQSVLSYLPRIVKAEKKHNLLLAQMMIGGCTLNRHIAELKKAEDDPNYKPYGTNYQKRRRVNLPEMIKAEKWDIVTIQQGSHESWNKEKFQPAANELIAYIRKNAPQAEIVVHQTWSYRNSDGRISGPKPGWGFDQKGMYDRLTANYTDLAKEHKLRVIPVGKAVQLFREKTPVKYTPPTAEEKKNLVCPDLPKRAGDVVANDWWAKDRKTGEMVLKTDSIHLNNDGNYLQGCVWYGFLFGEDPASIQFVPRNIGNKQAALLRTCASEALKTFPQVKK